MHAPPGAGGDRGGSGLLTALTERLHASLGSPQGESKADFDAAAGAALASVTRDGAGEAMADCNSWCIYSSTDPHSCHQGLLGFAEMLCEQVLGYLVLEDDMLWLLLIYSRSALMQG